MGGPYRTKTGWPMGSKSSRRPDREAKRRTSTKKWTDDLGKAAGTP